MTRTVLAFALCLALPATALAHPDVERARQLVLEGDYEAARASFERALARDDLDHDDLVALLEGQALLFHGLTEYELRDQALRALASFAPTHRFGPRFPPDLARRSIELGAELGGRLRVVVSHVPSAVGLRLDARVEHDSESLVRELRYRIFDGATAQWRAVTPPIEAPAGREVLVIVEAVGPGGAVIASEGSSDTPIRLRGPGAGSPGDGPNGLDASLSGGTENADDGGGLPDWAAVVLGVAAALVVGAAVGGSIYLVENPTLTWQPGTPTEVAP